MLVTGIFKNLVTIVFTERGQDKCYVAPCLKFYSLTQKEKEKKTIVRDNK